MRDQAVASSLVGQAAFLHLLDLTDTGTAVWGAMSMIKAAHPR
jgi:hypothetical protein